MITICLPDRPPPPAGRGGGPRTSIARRLGLCDLQLDLVAVAQEALRRLRRRQREGAHTQRQATPRRGDLTSQASALLGTA